MSIRESSFISSHSNYQKCPSPDLPEFAFIGRSNVGKSSLINMLTQRKNLAKTSGKPGKTQTINHFLINKTWYLVDLPGYGYAAVSKKLRKGWSQMIEEYLLNRKNLHALFVLIDARLDPQPIDMEFIQWAGEAAIPLCLILTKTDKITKNELARNRKKLEHKLTEAWAELPPMIISSATEKTGREAIIQFIETAMTT